MTHPSDALPAIAACLSNASNVAGLPIAVLDSGHIAASILTDLLPYLHARPVSIRRPFGAEQNDESKNLIMLCIPPHQVKLSDAEEKACRTLCDTLQIRLPSLTHWFYAAVALYHAGPQGKAMVLMPQTSLSRSAWRMGQQDFIDRKLIEAVVTLPGTITAIADEPCQPLQYRTNTVVYDTLVILSQPENRISADRITFVLPSEIDCFVDEKRCPNETDMTVSYEDVLNNGYLLTPFRYRESRPVFSDSVRLRDVATITRGVSKTRLRELRHLSVSSLGSLEPTPDGNTPIAYLTSKDFEHGYDYCHFNRSDALPSSLYFAAKDLEAKGMVGFSDDGILLSRTGTPFKACRLGCASFTRQVGAYLVADNLYHIQPTSALDADYLLAFFASAPGQLALSRSANSATTMQQISPNDLRDMLIPLPSLEKQRAIAARYRKQLDCIADMERQRDELANERNRWFTREM